MMIIEQIQYNIHGEGGFCPQMIEMAYNERFYHTFVKDFDEFVSLIMGIMTCIGIFMIGRFI